MKVSDIGGFADRMSAATERNFPISVAVITLTLLAGIIGAEQFPNWLILTGLLVGAALTVAPGAAGFFAHLTHQALTAGNNTTPSGERERV